MAGNEDALSQENYISDSSEGVIPRFFYLKKGRFRNFGN
jgi:hypothetical protein